MFDKEKAEKIVGLAKKSIDQKREKIEAYKARNSRFDTERLIKKLQLQGLCLPKDSYELLWHYIYNLLTGSPVGLPQQRYKER